MLSDATKALRRSASDAALLCSAVAVLLSSPGQGASPSSSPSEKAHCSSKVVDQERRRQERVARMC